jgi:copper chaperone CopZ
MKPISRRSALVLGAAFLVCGAAHAASPVTYTTIQVHNMHCSECAKKIARKLYAVPGVVQVRADVPKNLAYVVPQEGKDISPRVMWEAVESAGFAVARMTGPGGTHTTKPR